MFPTRRVRRFCEACSDEDMALLCSSAALLQRPSHALLVREGCLADGFFLIVHGTAVVSCKGSVVSARRGAPHTQLPCIGHSSIT